MAQSDILAFHASRWMLRVPRLLKSLQGVECGEIGSSGDAHVEMGAASPNLRRPLKCFK